MDTKEKDLKVKKERVCSAMTAILILVALTVVVHVGIIIGQYRYEQTQPPTHLLEKAQFETAKLQVAAISDPIPEPIAPNLRGDWPEGSDQFLGLKSEFTLSNPIVNNDLPARNPSKFSYVGSATVDCMYTISQEQIDCDKVAARLPVLLPDEVFKYYCVDGVCMEPGNCSYIVGTDPFWYDPKYRVDDVESLRKEYYPSMDSLCKSSPADL